MDCTPKKVAVIGEVAVSGGSTVNLCRISLTGLQQVKIFRRELEPTESHPRATGHHEETRDHTHSSGHA